MLSNFPSESFFDLPRFAYKDIFQNIGNAWESLSFISSYINSLFEKGIIKGNFNGREDIFVGEGATIHKGAEIIGPAIIGRNCVVDHASLIRGGCVIGDNCRIGHAVEVKHAIFLNDVSASHLSYVGDSIVGNGVNISGGTIIANYRLDKKTVTVKYKNKKIDTGLLKFGSIIGDGTRIGVNSVLNPGTIIGKNCLIYPLHSISGVYEENSIIK